LEKALKNPRVDKSINLRNSVTILTRMVKNKYSSTRPSSSGLGIIRATKRSSERAKNKRMDAEKQKEAIARSSSHIDQLDQEEKEEAVDEQLEISVTLEDREAISGRMNTPKKEEHVKDPNASGIKARVGWSPFPGRSNEGRKSTQPEGNQYRHRNRNRERHLRHDYITSSDMKLLTYLNRNTGLYDISVDVLTQMRSITLKSLNNLERVYRRLRRHERYSHYPSISRNIERNFRL
jgi:hypothetical protein